MAKRKRAPSSKAQPASKSVSPAPWIVDDDSDFGLAVFSADWAAEDGDGLPVCREVNGIGNAKLIAAAPDLLAVCIRALEEMETGAMFQQRENGEPTAVAKRSLKQLAKELKSAVAKTSPESA